MRVQNRKTGAEHTITLDDWNFMKSQNLHLIFKIIDKDSAGRTPVRINIPDQINEFKIARESVSDLKIEPLKQRVVEVPIDIEVHAEIKPAKPIK